MRGTNNLKEENKTGGEGESQKEGWDEETDVRRRKSGSGHENPG